MDDWTRIPDADDAPTPRETMLTGILGQLREFLRVRYNVEVVVVYRTPDHKVWRATNMERRCDVKQLLHAALEDESSLESLSEITEEL